MDDSFFCFDRDTIRITTFDSRNNPSRLSSIYSSFHECRDVYKSLFIQSGQTMGTGLQKPDAKSRSLQMKDSIILAHVTTIGACYLCKDQHFDMLIHKGSSSSVSIDTSENPPEMSLTPNTRKSWIFTSILDGVSKHSVQLLYAFRYPQSPIYKFEQIITVSNICENSIRSTQLYLNRTPPPRLLHAHCIFAKHPLFLWNTHLLKVLNR